MLKAVSVQHPVAFHAQAPLMYVVVIMGYAHAELVSHCWYAPHFIFGVRVLCALMQPYWKTQEDNPAHVRLAHTEFLVRVHSLLQHIQQTIHTLFSFSYGYFHLSVCGASWLLMRSISASFQKVCLALGFAASANRWQVSVCVVLHRFVFLRPTNSIYHV